MFYLGTSTPASWTCLTNVVQRIPRRALSADAGTDYKKRRDGKFMIYKSKLYKTGVCRSFITSWLGS